MTAYIFVFAAILSVCAVLTIVKMNINKLIAQPDQFVRIQNRFFIGIACSKIIPVGILIWGITRIKPASSINELYLPWVIILITIGIGLTFITSQKKLDVKEDAQIAINTLVTIARPLLFSIPIMAMLFIYLMVK